MTLRQYSRAICRFGCHIHLQSTAAAVNALSKNRRRSARDCTLPSRNSRRFPVGRPLFERAQSPPRTTLQTFRTSLGTGIDYRYEPPPPAWQEDYGGRARAVRTLKGGLSVPGPGRGRGRREQRAASNISTQSMTRYASSKNDYITTYCINCLPFIASIS